jgi:hypothetical protein
MIRCNTGSSILDDAFEAGKQAASKAKEGLSDIKMAFVYSSVAYASGDLLAGIKQELPNTPFIGNTSSAGVITPEGFISSDDGFVGIMAVSGDVEIGIAGGEKTGDPRECGKQLALQAMKNAGKTTAPDYFYMAAPPAEEEFFLAGVSEAIGRVPFFGGSAADNEISGAWELYTQEGHFSDGLVLAFFYGDMPMTNLFTGAYRETDNVGIITKVRDNRVLVEIDGEPALKKYASWAGVDPESLKGGELLVYTITSPLGVKDRMGKLTAIRHPMNGNDDYSMNIGANLAEKTAIIRMEGSVDGLISSAADKIRELIESAPTPPSALHLVHCGGRLVGIGNRRDEMAAAVLEAAGDIPFIMEFTFGEYGFVDDGANTVGGLMLSYTAF